MQRYLKMSIIYKSNVSADSALLGKGLDISSPQDIYSAYEQRVLDFGGEIINPAKCLVAITKAVNGGYFKNTALATNADWGVLKSGTKAVRLFSLTGASEDTIIPNGGLEYSTTADNNSKLVFTTNNSLTTSYFRAANTNSNGLVISSLITARSTMTGANYAFVKDRLAVTKAAVGFSRTTDYVALYARTYIESTGAITAAPTLTSTQLINSASTYYLNTVNHAFTPLINAGVGVTTPVGGNYFDFAAADVRIEYPKAVGMEYTETWVLNSATLSTAQKLSIDQKNR